MRYEASLNLRSDANHQPRMPELEEQIRSCAYEIYDQRGKNEGHDIDDWLQAEAKLTPKSETAAA